MNPRKNPAATQKFPSPVLRILEVNDTGMVFESRQAFSVGCSIELGFEMKAGPTDCGSGSSKYLTAEGTVVSSVDCSSAKDLPVYELTLMFSSLDYKERCRLQAFFHQAAPATSPPSKPWNDAQIGLN